MKMDDEAEKRILSDRVSSVEYETPKNTIDATTITEMETEDYTGISKYIKYNVKAENENQDYKEASLNILREESQMQRKFESIEHKPMMLFNDAVIKKETVCVDSGRIKLEPVVLLKKIKIENFGIYEVSKLVERTQEKIKGESSKNYVTDVKESCCLSDGTEEIHKNTLLSSLPNEEGNTGNSKITETHINIERNINTNNKTSQIHKCKICNKSVTTKYILKHHMGLHVEESEFECLQCGRFFGSEKTLLRHKLFHRKEHKCDICGSYFAFKSQLITHSYCHIVEKQYKCNVCEKFLKSKSAIRDHVKIHQTEKFQCKICEKYYSSKYHLIEHMLIHGSEKKFKCGVCNKRFLKNGSLTQHLASHMEIGKYKCDECGQCLNLRSNLVRHLRSHSGKKRFECAICIKHFTTRPSLFRHIKLVHNFDNAEVFICDICMRGFKEKRLLALHLQRVHYPMKKKFQCGICEKCFLTKPELSGHIEYHIGERNHKCTYCNKCYISKSNLFEHMCNRHKHMPYHSVKN